jgi:hypothetical protein
MADHLPARVSAGAAAVLASLYVQSAWIACLGLLLGACAYQPSESEVGGELSPQDQKILEKLNQEEQASNNQKTHLKNSCDKMFSDLRAGMRLRDSDPTMTQCAQISYTKTLHNNHEVWTWNDGGGRSVYVDNGIVTTINGTLSSTTEMSRDGVEAP